jgi:hypothetical protein
MPEPQPVRSWCCKCAAVSGLDLTDEQLEFVGVGGGSGPRSDHRGDWSQPALSAWALLEHVEPGEGRGEITHDR